MIVLGIESSCDETAVGIVSNASEPEARLLANQVASQLDAHRPYGGVVPEIAARAHLEAMDALLEAALAEAGIALDAVDGFAATCGPGLIGGVMVGAMTGKALAAATGKPFIAVNHLEGHALTARLTSGATFPYLLLLVSGGHCQLVWVEGVGLFRQLGTTLDDAAGECFDKCAKTLGLGYPGGPMIEKAAARGRADAFALPQPLRGRAGCDFSFSGLKTAVRLAAEKQGSPLPEGFAQDMAASLQQTVASLLQDRCRNALALLAGEGLRPTALVAGGGVAANGAIRGALTQLCAAAGLPFLAPPPALCTDNGVMIAWAGLERLRLGLCDDLRVKSRPRWPLEALRETAIEK